MTAFTVVKVQFFSDTFWGQKFLDAKCPGEKMPDSQYPVINTASLLRWKMLSILMDIANCANLFIKIYKKYVVLIIGSSLVYWGKVRSVELENENLEFDKDFIEIFWKGIRGMKWESLLDTIEFCKSKCPLPDFIIIHLGPNDITFSCSKKLSVKILADLECIQGKFPNCKIIFSELLLSM
jgi:hypothetical protein